MLDKYRNLIFTDESSNNWLYEKYYYAGSNSRYWTFQLALNLLAQKTSHPIIVETGCQRMKDDLGAGMSTSIFGEYCQRHGGKLYTLDITPNHIEICKECTKEYSNNITYMCDDSVNSLKILGDKNIQVDLLYLDSVDFPIGPAAHDKQMRDLSQNHCISEFDIASKHGIINQNTILLIDDNQLPYGGKPKLLKEKLIGIGGWDCLLDLQQSLWIQK